MEEKNILLRNIMNSKNLQKIFSDVYEDFFSKNQLVISAPRLLWWTGEYAELYGGPAITQKIPLRVYIGFNPQEEKKIKIGSYKVYIPSREGFFDSTFDSLTERRLLNFLHNYFLIDPRLNNKEGIEINILTELPLEHGQGSLGTLSAALSLSLYLYYNLLDEKKIAAWNKYQLKELINNKSLGLAEVHRLAWKIETAIDTNKTSGCRSFTSLVNSEFPILYFTEARSGDKINHPNARFPSEIEGDYSLIDQIEYWAETLDKFYHLKNYSPWPIDYGLIYGGVLKVTGTVIQSVKNIEHHLSFISEYTQNKFKDILSNTEKTPTFYKLTKQENGLSLWNRYIDAMSALSLEVLEAMEQVYKSGGVEENVAGLFHYLNCYHDFFHLLSLSNKKLNYVCSLLEEEANKLEIEIMGLKFSGSGGGGDILFALPFGKNRNHIGKIIDYLKKEINEEINFDYISWLDGVENEGARIEQDVRQKKYSKYMKKGSYLVKIFNPQVGREVFSQARFEKEKNKMEFLIDELNQKILLNGVLIHSKHLHSSKETIKILKILLENINKNLSARDLPQSSYIDRNEMQSKIISPLNKLTNRIFGKKLPIRIKGGLRKNYNIILETPNIPIYIIEDKI